MTVDRILLTNDDGIDAVGLRAMHDALADEYEVTVVAPTEDRSSIGRAASHEVNVADHELGYAVAGTPVDCVIAGLGTLVPDADAVVAGCNKGANLGGYVLGRSGTVSAAVEATFFDVPAIAASMYVPGGDDWWRRDLGRSRFAHATQATRFLVDHAIGGGVFDRVEYLNINAPIADDGREMVASGGETGDNRSHDVDDIGDDNDADTDRAPMRVTRPSPWYGMDAERNGADEIVFRDRIWDRMRDDDVPDPVGTDRRAVLDGEVSVSPLSAPHAAVDHDALDELVTA
ncbi:5'/3'-nucleotidase SurE [Halorubrum luteum]